MRELLNNRFLYINFVLSSDFELLLLWRVNSRPHKALIVSEIRFFLAICYIIYVLTFKVVKMAINSRWNYFISLVWETDLNFCVSSTTERIKFTVMLLILFLQKYLECRKITLKFFRLTKKVLRGNTPETWQKSTIFLKLIFFFLGIILQNVQQYTSTET